MKAIIFSLAMMTFMGRAFADADFCGKPSVQINGVSSVRTVEGSENTRIVSKNILEGEVMIDGKKVGASTDRSLDILVAQTAIQEGAVLCESVVRNSFIVFTRRLYIKR